MIFDGMSLALEIAIIAIAAILLIIGIWALFLQISIFFSYFGNNKKKLGNGKTAKDVAEEMLAKLGYNEIQVVRASYFWFFFFQRWGNRYSPRRKKILLYGNILNKSTVTAIALATQKVGLVIQHKNGEKRMMYRAKWEPWTRFAPNLFLYIIALGAGIDYAINNGNWEASTFGIITLVFVCIAIVYTIIAFVTLYRVIPTEKRAGELALEIIEKNQLIPTEHIGQVSKMYKQYVKLYIADFLLAILNLIIDIIYVVSAASKYR